MTQDAAAEIVVSPETGRTSDQIREMWSFRELLYFFSWKEIKIRYRQSVLGAFWAGFQPLALMIVFSIFFGRLARIPSDGIPYPLFYFSALTPWAYLSSVVGGATHTISTNQNLVQKVYFPRLVLPFATAIAGLLDLGIALILLFGLTLLSGFGIGVAMVWIPVLLVLLILTAVAAGIWLSALNALYRDVRLAVPLGLQLWLFLSPVAYPSSLVPDRWRWVYSLNPLAGIVEGFRWALTGAGEAPGVRLLVSAGIVLVVLAGGLRYFWRAEATFADVV